MMVTFASLWIHRASKVVDVSGKEIVAWKVVDGVLVILVVAPVTQLFCLSDIYGLTNYPNA